MQQAIDYINNKIEKYSKVVSDMDTKYIGNEIKYTYHGGFDHGYSKGKLTALEDLKDELQALPDGWIPVTERLPEKEGEYLTCVDLSFNKAIFHEHCIRQLDWDGDNFGDGEGCTHKITHWMPLPLPPKQ